MRRYLAYALALVTLAPVVTAQSSLRLERGQYSDSIVGSGVVECGIDFYTKSPLLEAGQEALLQFGIKGDPERIKELCSNSGDFPSTAKDGYAQGSLVSVIGDHHSLGAEGTFTEGDLLLLVRQYGAKLLERLKPEIENPHIDFAFYDKILTSYLGDDAPKTLVDRYNAVSSFMWENKEIVKDFIGEAETNPAVRPLWETQSWDDHTALDVAFIARRLLNLGYGPDDFDEGLKTLDGLVGRYSRYKGFKAPELPFDEVFEKATGDRVLIP